ncbi:unnamed protein product (macronuclear) [Paramecium tetraurelia]|uniref:Transmembrane protein n=1 Tax=Paramecium tetraurelia TaxID=5888 RepID=A0C3D0_PARTE|nr:uncharacterized protein GSPATT00034776001 [Paramecium tetraurelia]CAK65297.1 unnamed protein product [Paramecium tetraurelia]|eukprot:XP_001432694.1 hypothetical protein (macronuclear) [Paramecium tetraurelia strain d4-2]
MSTSRYISKKLQPFLTSKQELTQLLQKLEKEQKDEETQSDQYFDQLARVEKEYETLVHILEEYGKKIANNQNGETDQAQDADFRIEKAVIETLNLYLLANSRKEQLEALQEREIAKRQSSLNLTLGKHVNNEQKIVEDDNQLNEDEYGYYVTLKSEDTSMDVKIPATIKTFKELKQIIKSCFMLEENEIFCTDLMGNLFQDNMVLLDEIYPPLFDLMKNYQPIIGIQVVKQVKLKEVIQSGDESLLSDDGARFFIKRFQTIKPVQKKVNWNIYFGYLNNFKYFIETILFLMVLGLFFVVQIDSFKFTTSSSVITSFGKQIQISKSLLSPIQNISQLINQTLNDDTDNTLYPTYPLVSGLLIQTLVKEEKLQNCSILNPNQKQLFIDNNQSCLDFSTLLTDNLSGEYEFNIFNPTIYNQDFGGYVWELNLASKEEFNENIQLLQQKQWVQYNVKSSKFILNYFNSPSKRLIQVVITTIYLFNDMLLNYNTIALESFNLNKPSETEDFYDEIIFYLSILLLSLSFLDFFAIYKKTSENPFIFFYHSYCELKNKQKKLQSKKKELQSVELQELQQKELIMGDYFILKISSVYVVIKIPLIFDFVYILSNITLLVRKSIQDLYTNALDDIQLNSNVYQDTDKLYVPAFILKIYTGVQVLLLMGSIIRFLGNWSPYLKCYGLVMIRFNKQSSFLLLVLIFIISISAMSWSITIQGKLMYQENFFYDFLGLLRCSLKYGMHNDLSELGLENNYQKQISYSFETRYVFKINKIKLQYLIILVISYIMVPIFISLMTQQVHNTKQEAEQKMLEMQKEKQEEKLQKKQRQK